MRALAVDDDPIMTPSSHPSLLNPRLGHPRQTPGPSRAQESNNIDFTPVAGPPSVISSDTAVTRLRTLLAHPSSSPSGKYPLTRPDRYNSGMSETDITPAVDRARERLKGKRKSLDDDEDDKPISPPLSLLLQKANHLSKSELFPLSLRAGGEVWQTMSSSSTPHGTTPLISSTPQDGPEVETHKADVTPARVYGDSLVHLNYTAMKTPEPPRAWTVTPASIPLKHALRVTSPPPASSSELTPTASSSRMPLSRVNSEPERRSMPETLAGNGLFTPIYPLSHAKYLHARTPAPTGAWMLTTTRNLSNEQSKIGSIRGKKQFLKVRFDVTESGASTAEVEHQVLPVTDMRMPTPDSLPNSRVSWSENVPRTSINGFSQADAIHDKVDSSRPGRHMTPISRASSPLSRPLRKAFSVKVVDAFGRERTDEFPIPIAKGRAGTGDAIRASPSAKARTPRVSSKNKVCVINASGREVQKDVPERSSLLYDNPSSCRTAALAQIRRTLRERAGGLSDEDRPLDNLALNPSHFKELEERSSAARRPRNQLAQTLRIESAKERERDLMHKYTKGAEDRSELLPIITGGNGSFKRDLVWVGVLLQIVFVLAMWRFAHVQARHLFCVVYYEPLYPNLNPRISGRAWDRWTERPDTETWPPT